MHKRHFLKMQTQQRTSELGQGGSAGAQARIAKRNTHRSSHVNFDGPLVLPRDVVKQALRTTQEHVSESQTQALQFSEGKSERPAHKQHCLP